MQGGSYDSARIPECFSTFYLTFRTPNRESAPVMRTDRQVAPADSASFLRRHRVFTLADLVASLPLRSGRRTALERVRYLSTRGRLKVLGRGVYASVPPDVEARDFQPDPFLVAVAMRPDLVFSHHAALQLHGAAHSVWSEVAGWTGGRRGTVRLGSAVLRFLAPPSALGREAGLETAVETTRREGRALRLTSRERTLLECLRQPHLAGGLEEVVESAAGFPSLDLPALKSLLGLYDQRALWAATGWFLERHTRTFRVGPAYLAELEAHRPRSPHYLPRGLRGGVLAARWNLVLPRELTRGREPDEP